ncbi:MAG TPA: flavin-dependent oxidoreductase [bacterium]|nr:flavin-dependent oxidoreductase [bacterium]
MEVIIVGAGIGGLTLGLMLHRAGIPFRVYEAAPEIKPVGVGINILPHASKELCELGLEEALTRVAVTTAESRFFNRFGQFIWSEPAGRFAGYAWPQYSIHRGDLQRVLLEALVARAGPDCVRTGRQCTGADQDTQGVTVRFENPVTRAPWPAQRGSVVVSCEGLHSTLRKQLHPEEGEPVYSGVNMWRGVTRWPPFLSGASMTRVGWFTPAKMVIYPIRNRVDESGRQLVNWVVEVQTPRHQQRDWNRAGRLEDFFDRIADWRFDWLDVPEFLRRSEMVLEFPMVDQDPLPWWGQGRITLLGDAAHPMVPRGSNGAGQAILDCRELCTCLAEIADPVQALQAYEGRRLPATSNVVLTNRKNPPDAILREVYLRTGDRPFARIEDVISRAELTALSEGYKRVAGYDQESLRERSTESAKARG